MGGTGSGKKSGKKSALTPVQRAADQAQRMRDRRAAETQATKEAFDQKMRTQHLPVSSFFSSATAATVATAPAQRQRAQDPAFAKVAQELEQRHFEHAVRESLAEGQRTAAVRTQSDVAALGQQSQPSQRGTADQARHEPLGEHESRPSDAHVAHPDAAYDEDESAATQLLTAVRHMVRDTALVNEIGTTVLAEMGLTQEQACGDANKQVRARFIHAITKRAANEAGLGSADEISEATQNTIHNLITKELNPDNERAQDVRTEGLRAESPQPAAARADQQHCERREKLPEPESEVDGSLQPRLLNALDEIFANDILHDHITAAAGRDIDECERKTPAGSQKLGNAIVHDIVTHAAATVGVNIQTLPDAVRDAITKHAVLKCMQAQREDRERDEASRHTGASHTEDDDNNKDEEVDDESPMRLDPRSPIGAAAACFSFPASACPRREARCVQVCTSQRRGST